MKWSKFQMDIFSEYKNTDNNISIGAGPGSGKTTVLKQLSKLTPVSESSIFLAFNKSIVNELKKHLSSHVEVSTLHSLGCRALYREYGAVKVNEIKTFLYLKKLEKKWKGDLKEVKNINYYLFNISQLYDLYRMNLLTGVGGEIIQLGYRHGLETSPLILKHLELLIIAITKSNKILRSGIEIDFLDMIYLPVIQNLNISRYDRVFLDEAQDLNYCQHQLVNKIMKRTTRLISVGDENQCIYSFLGADVDSFKSLRGRRNTTYLTLPITYRCAKKIVDKVNEVYDVVRPAEDAIEGIVRDGSMSDVEADDMVLCRNNKPLLLAYFRLLADEKKSFIRGAEFGKGIVRMITPYKNYNVDFCLTSLYGELEKLADKLFNQNIPKPTEHRTYLKFEENIELLKIIGTRYSKISEVLPVVENIFKNDGEGIMLTTIHKAKGLEAERVFLLNPELLPSKFAQAEWEIQQENNLKFVAYSRAKSELVFIRHYE